MVKNSLSHRLAWAGFPICRVCPVLATTAPPGPGLSIPLTSLLLSGPSALAKTPAPLLATPRTGLPFRPSQRAVLWVVTAHSERPGTKWLKTYGAKTVHLEKLPPVEQWARRHKEKLSNARRCLPSECVPSVKEVGSMPLKSSQCFQSTRGVISHKMRHSSALGGGTEDPAETTGVF